MVFHGFPSVVSYKCVNSFMILDGIVWDFSVFSELLEPTRDLF